MTRAKALAEARRVLAARRRQTKPRLRSDACKTCGGSKLPPTADDDTKPRWKIRPCTCPNRHGTIADGNERSPDD